MQHLSRPHYPTYLLTIVSVLAIHLAWADDLVEGSIIMDSLKDGSKGPELIIVPKGSFLLGNATGQEYNANENPIKPIQIKRTFAVGRYEVTMAEFTAYCTAKRIKPPFDERWGNSRRPVININWFEAVDYTRWLSEQTGYRYRLPTELEWEYIAKARSETAYWWGSEMKPNYAHCQDCGLRLNKTQIVGQYPANAFGVYDTAGNVWEWTASPYMDRYQGQENINAGELPSPPMAVAVRGGAWSSGAIYLRSSRRDFRTPQYRYYGLGFRVLREIETSQ